MSQTNNAARSEPQYFPDVVESSFRISTLLVCNQSGGVYFEWFDRCFNSDEGSTHQCSFCQGSDWRKEVWCKERHKQLFLTCEECLCFLFLFFNFRLDNKHRPTEKDVIQFTMHAWMRNMKCLGHTPILCKPAVQVTSPPSPSVCHTILWNFEEALITSQLDSTVSSLSRPRGSWHWLLYHTGCPYFCSCRCNLHHPRLNPSWEAKSGKATKISILKIHTCSQLGNVLLKREKSNKRPTKNVMGQP